MKQAAILFFIVLLMKAAFAQKKPLPQKAAQAGNTLLWQVSGRGLKKPSYLFGTFHIMCKKDMPVGKTVHNAVAAVNSVYMEMDMDDPKIMLGGMKYVYMKDGKKLKDFFVPEEYSRLEKFFKDSIGIPLALMQTMKPLTLEALVYTYMMDCETPSGVEAEIQKIAKKNKKEIYGFETMEFQGSVFDSIPYEVQAKNLLQITDSLEQFRSYFNATMQVYKKQLLDSLDQLSKQYDFGEEKNMDLLLYKRNINWVNQLNRILKKQSVFIAVGAGHLPGEKGLIGLLRKEGYSVTPLWNK